LRARAEGDGDGDRGAARPPSGAPVTRALPERLVSQRKVLAPPEATLLAARRGDTKAWEDLYRLYARGLHGFLMLRLADRDDAEEALSETFLRALEKLGSYRGGVGSLRAWLFSIARNVSTDRLRRRNRVRLDVSVPELIDLTNGDPDDGLIAAGHRAALAHALASLPPADREILWLRVGEGLSSEEVGRVVGKRPGAVRMQQMRALRSLIAAFEG